MKYQGVHSSLQELNFDSSKLWFLLSILYKKNGCNSDKNQSSIVIMQRQIKVTEIWYRIKLSDLPRHRTFNTPYVITEIGAGIGPVAPVKPPEHPPATL